MAVIKFAPTQFEFHKAFIPTALCKINYFWSFEIWQTKARLLKYFQSLTMVQQWPVSGVSLWNTARDRWTTINSLVIFFLTPKTYVYEHINLTKATKFSFFIKQPPAYVFKWIKIVPFNIPNCCYVLYGCYLMLYFYTFAYENLYLK